MSLEFQHLQKQRNDCMTCLRTIPLYINFVAMMNSNPNPTPIHTIINTPSLHWILTLCSATNCQSPGRPSKTSTSSSPGSTNIGKRKASLPSLHPAFSTSLPLLSPSLCQVFFFSFLTHLHSPKTALDKKYAVYGMLHSIIIHFHHLA